MEKDLKTIVQINNKLLQQGYKKYEIANELGFAGSNDNASSWLAKKLRKAERKGYDVLWSYNKPQADSSDYSTVRDKNMSKLTYSNIPSVELPIDELWSRRENEWKRVKANADAENKIDIAVNEDQPIGLLLMGDPHLDNLGCNITKLLSDVKLAETTEGLYATNIGDTTDNWVGYLTKLYAKNETTRNASYVLLENLMQRVPWLFMVDGNHDKFQAMEIYNRICKDYNVLNISDEANVELTFKNGAKFNIHARHNYPGKSQWSGALGQVKWAKMRGQFDILIGGHTHSCAYEEVVIKDVSTNKYRVSHCEQLGSYKVVDDYAKTGGFEDTNVRPSVLYILNPNTDDVNKRCVRFTDVEMGAKYLTYLRSLENTSNEK